MATIDDLIRATQLSQMPSVGNIPLAPMPAPSITPVPEQEMAGSTPLPPSRVSSTDYQNLINQIMAASQGAVPAPRQVGRGELIARSIGAGLLGISNPALAMQANQQIMQDVNAPEQFRSQQAALQNQTRLDLLRGELDRMNRVRTLEEELAVKEPYQQIRGEEKLQAEKEKRDLMLENARTIAEIKAQTAKDLAELQNKMKLDIQENFLDFQTAKTIANNATELQMNSTLTSGEAYELAKAQFFNTLTPQQSKRIIDSVAKRKATASEKTAGAAVIRATRSGGSGSSGGDKVTLRADKNAYDQFSSLATNAIQGGVQPAQIKGTMEGYLRSGMMPTGRTDASGKPVMKRLTGPETRMLNRLKDEIGAGKFNKTTPKK